MDEKTWFEVRLGIKNQFINLYSKVVHIESGEVLAENRPLSTRDVHSRRAGQKLAFCGQPKTSAYKYLKEWEEDSIRKRSYKGRYIKDPVLCKKCVNNIRSAK